MVLISVSVSSIFFLKLCNTLKSILTDNILEITPQKRVQAAQILDVSATCKFTHKKILPKRTSCLLPRVVVLLKNCIVLILMQKSYELLNNIVVYLYSNCCLKKKLLVPLHICNSWCTKLHFWGIQQHCSKSEKVLRTLNTIISCIYVAIDLVLWISKTLKNDGN